MGENLAVNSGVSESSSVSGERPRIDDDRKVFDAIFLVAKNGCQWKALDTTGICFGSTAHLRFQQWTETGFF